jgi:LytS/YehU family sensor histidine kinase
MVVTKQVVSLLIIGATAFSWYRRQDKIEQELRVKKKLTELELANLRIQMNPHFIFNCLDTVKLQVIGGSPKVAISGQVQQINAQILEYSSKDFIPLEDEIDF